MKKRINAAVISGFLCLGLLFSQVQSVWADAGTENEAEKETVRVWCWDDNYNVKAMKLAEAEYEKQQKNVDIQVVSMDQENILEQLNSNMTSGIYDKLPDILLIEDYRVKACLQKYSDEFLDLTDEIDYSKYVDYKINAVTLDGRHYGIPFDSAAAVMFYRLDILEQAGYTEKDMENITWERYIEIGKDVVEKTGIKMVTIDPTDLGPIRIMLQSVGSWYVKEDGVTADIEGNEKLKEAVGTYLKLLESGIVSITNGWDSNVASYQQGKVVTVISGSWSAPSIKEAKEQSGKWRIARIPRLEGCENAVNAAGNGGSAWYILKKGTDQGAALEFLKTMFADNLGFTDTLMEEINFTSVHKDVARCTNYEKQEEFFGGIPFFKVCAEISEDVPEVNFGSCTYEIEAVLTGAIQSILKGEDMDSVFAQAQIKSQSILGGIF